MVVGTGVCCKYIRSRRLATSDSTKYFFTKGAWPLSSELVTILGEGVFEPRKLLACSPPPQSVKVEATAGR